MLRMGKKIPVGQRKVVNEWIYVDLGSVQPVGGVRLDWEASFGKGYKIQVSDDAKTWKEVYKTDEGRGGVDEITFPEVDARYVRMFGTELGWWFGYSLWSFDVLGGTQLSEGLSDVHFIRLTLKDKSGRSDQKTITGVATTVWTLRL